MTANIPSHQRAKHSTDENFYNGVSLNTVVTVSSSNNKNIYNSGKSVWYWSKGGSPKPLHSRFGLIGGWHKLSQSGIVLYHPNFCWQPFSSSTRPITGREDIVQGKMKDRWMQNKQAKNMTTETANRKKVKCAAPMHFSLA